MSFPSDDAQTPTPVSGEQFELSLGDQRAVIASVGASLRLYRVEGRDLVVPFAADELRPAYRGATVAPWPNRVVDGRYGFDEQDFQLAITEVGRDHALHGFTPWLAFTPRNRTPHSVTLVACVEPQAGYPWRVEVETTYELGDRGLTQRVTARNLSAHAAPYGVCPHPYLVAGEGRVDDWVLTLPADSVLEVTVDRLAPTELAPVTVDSDRFDFRAARLIADAEIDHAFTGLHRDDAGLARVELRAAGSGVAMTWDAACPWLQIHTADLSNPAHPGHRAGLAVEPMTCAPDAFNRGQDAGLVVLAPGATHTASWSIGAL
ncbi:aldose 1-epimerase family protein [Leucobacter sp. HY1908]